jgi:hypothetical protein
VDKEKTMSLNTQVLAHQAATDTPDSVMIRILCDFIEKLDDEGHPPAEVSLEDYLVERLERVPGDLFDEHRSAMPRYDPRFNEQDQQLMFEGALEEGSDLGRKEIAQLVMDSWDLTSCIAACTIINGEHRCEELAQILQRLDQPAGEDYVNGEFLRMHDDDGDDYGLILDFAKRMGLINEEETECTELGKEYYAALV